MCVQSIIIFCPFVCIYSSVSLHSADMKLWSLFPFQCHAHPISLCLSATVSIALSSMLEVLSSFQLCIWHGSCKTHLPSFSQQSTIAFDVFDFQPLFLWTWSMLSLTIPLLVLPCIGIHDLMSPGSPCTLDTDCSLSIFVCTRSLLWVASNTWAWHSLHLISWALDGVVLNCQPVYALNNDRSPFVLHFKIAWLLMLVYLHCYCVM